MAKMKFFVRDRKFHENLEFKTLAPYAVKSAGANSTRRFKETEHPYRTALQRDRDRVIHSRAFRRLKHKQQVFLISEGDHYRTRLTHTLEVSQLSRTLAKALGLNELLVEAIALGHDLGHTPFGHVGEVVLNNILLGKDDLDGLLPLKNFGGFKHNYQCLRVVDRIEKKYDFDGLNLTSFVREGILKHTRLMRNIISYPQFYYEGLNYELDNSTTLEGQVVAICDEIAQRTHDLEDGIRAGFVEIEQIKDIELIKLLNNKMINPTSWETDRYNYRNQMINGLINLLIDDVINTSIKNLENFYFRKNRLDFFDEELVRFSDQLNPLQEELNQFIYERIIYKCAGNDINHTNRSILRKLFKMFLREPLLLPTYVQNRIEATTKIPKNQWNKVELKNNPLFVREIADHLAGMTDSYAEKESKKALHENQI